MLAELPAGWRWSVCAFGPLELRCAVAAALLGGSHPLAAAASAMLFAALGAGSSAMQRDTGVPGALATIVPGVLVLAVLAARARLTQKDA